MLWLKYWTWLSFPFGVCGCLWETTGNPTLVSQLTGVRLNFNLVVREKQMNLYFGLIS